jgi:hypothetical protein
MLTIVTGKSLLELAHNVFVEGMKIISNGIDNGEAIGQRWKVFCDILVQVKLVLL